MGDPATVGGLCHAAERPIHWAATVLGRSIVLSVPILLIALAASGCVAFKEPLSQSVIEPGATPDLSFLHVRIRHPMIDDPLPPERQFWTGLAPSDVLEFAISNSDHVLSALSDSGVFASVAYSEGTPPEPSVLIRPVFPPPSGYCDGQDILLPFLTLGIFPAMCERDQGVYFRFVDRLLPDFACRWPQTEMAGWFPALLGRSFGSWTSEPNTPAFNAHVRSCIASQSEAFSPATRP